MFKTFKCWLGFHSWVDVTFIYDSWVECEVCCIHYDEVSMPRGKRARARN